MNNSINFLLNNGNYSRSAGKISDKKASAANDKPAGEKGSFFKSAAQKIPFFPIAYREMFLRQNKNNIDNQAQYKKTNSSIETDDYDRYMLDKAKNGTLTETDLFNWSNAEYIKIRRIDDSKIYKNDLLQRVIDNPQVAGIKVIESNNWKYRSAGDFFKEQDRASLSAVNNPNLINELDLFMKTGEYTYCNIPHKVENPVRFYYKTPKDASHWFEREDPVSFYFDSKLNDETYNALLQITQKYQNGALHNKEGELINWFAVESSPRESLIKPLIMEAAKLNNTLASFIYNKSTDYGRRDYILSSAEYEALCNITKKIYNYS